MQGILREWNFRAEHGYMRQSFAQLLEAVEAIEAPCAGDLKLERLKSAADFFCAELPRHILAEETTLYGHFAGAPGSGELRRLRAEHTRLLDLAQRFQWWMKRLLADPSDPAEREWPVVRRLVNEFECALRLHLEHEEGFVAAMARAGYGAPTEDLLHPVP